MLRALQRHVHRRRDRHHRGKLATAADLDHRGGAASVAALGGAFGCPLGIGGVGDSGRDVAPAPDLGDQGHCRRKVAGERRVGHPAVAIIAVDGPVALIEDHDPVMVEAFGHEGADLEVEPAGIEAGAAALGHRFVPPGDAAHLAQGAGEAPVDRIVDQLGLRADDIFVHLARGIEDDGDHHRPDDEHQPGHRHDETPRRGQADLLAESCHVLRHRSSLSGGG